MKANRIRKFFVSLGSCLAIIAIGAAVTFYFTAVRAKDTSKQVQATVAETLANVAVQPVTRSTVNDYLDLTGFVEPWEEITLSAQTRGQIEWQPVEEGDVVAQGQELVKVNTTIIAANIDQARAEHTMAVQDLARIESLRKSGINSPQELDQAISKRDAASARLRLAEIQLEQSVITAKIGGIIDKKDKEEGEYVDMGTTLLHIAQVDKVKAIVGIPERDVAHFNRGARVMITFDAHPGKSFEGTIYRVATSAEVASRTFAAEIEVDNAQGLLKPGMIARARFIRQTWADAITAPLFAIVPREGQRVVFVEENGVAVQRPVQIGFFQDDFVLVTKGLNENERMIVSGHRDLRDGQRVNVIAPATGE